MLAALSADCASFPGRTINRIAYRPPSIDLHTENEYGLGGRPLALVIKAPRREFFVSLTTAYQQPKGIIREPLSFAAFKSGMLAAGMRASASVIM